MNIGIRLHDVAGTALNDRLENAKKQGFSCAHVAMQKVVPGFTMPRAHELITDTLAATTRAAFEAYDLQPAVIGCYLNLATPDPDEQEMNLGCYQAHLRLAKKIGALVVGTETGAPNTGYKTCPECFTQEALQLFIRRLEPIVRYAQEIGQDIAIEPVTRHIVCNVQRTKQVLDALQSPRLRVILDTVNLLNMENRHQCDMIVKEAFDLFGDRIAVLHMKDYLPVEGATEVRSLACGLGEMKYDRLLAFAAAHPGLPMTLEDTIPQNAEAARLYLENCAAAL